jgi:hypothetical protein
MFGTQNRKKGYYRDSSRKMLQLIIALMGFVVFLELLSVLMFVVQNSETEAYYTTDGLGNVVALRPVQKND